MKKTDRAKFKGDALKSARERLDLSQQAAATKARVSIGAWRLAERGVASSVALAKMTGALGLELADVGMKP